MNDLKKEKHTTITSQEIVNTQGILLLSAISALIEDIGTLTSRINKQLGVAATGSSTSIDINVEAQNNADKNSREIIVRSEVST